MFGYLERIMREDTVFKALTIEDTDSLAGLFGAVRFCYNKALYLKTHFYPKSRSKRSRYSSENDVLIEKSVKYTDFFLLSIVYV